MRYVEIWLDGHGSIGCGYRHCLVLSAGRKWVKVFEPSSCKAQRIPASQFDTNVTQELDASRKLKAIIRRRAKAIGDTSKQTRRVIKAL